MSPLHHLRLIMAFALLISPAYAQNFPYAKDTFKNNELQHWSLEEVRAYRDKVIGDLTDKKTIPEKDNAACSALLGYWSKQVEGKRVEEQDNTNGDDPEAVIFKTELDLTAHDGLVYFALQVDDEATLTVTEIPTSADPTEHTPITETYDIKGTALWRVDRSYKEFSNSIPAGRKYDLRLNYLNTANLTDKYDGLVDYDGVNVFLMHHPAVDLDVDSNNTEGFEFTWGHLEEDKIEASSDPSEPGKIIAVPLDPDADKDGVPDALDLDGISSAKGSTKFVQMVVSIPPNYDPETATLEFDYKMSQSHVPEVDSTENMSGFRIWTKDAIVARSTAEISETSSTTTGYLIPEDKEISWKSLAAQCLPAKEGVYDGPAIILYIETVLISDADGTITALPFRKKEEITVSAKPKSKSSEFNTSDTVNIAVRCTGGVKISGPKDIVVNDNHHNRDASGNQIDKWDYTNDRTGTLDPDVLPIAIEVIALDQDVWVTLSSEAMKGLGEPGTPATGGLIDGVFPGYTEPQGADEITDEDGQSKIGWKSVPYTIEVKKNTTFKQNLYIEGQRHSSTVDDVVIKSETTGKNIETGDEKTCIATTESEHKMTVYQVDLDVDSDNNSGFTFTSGTDEEDKIEVSEALSGKLIIKALNPDTNNDGIPDYDNGVDNKAVNKDAKFIPIKISLPKPYDPSYAEIKFAYEEAKISNTLSSSGMRIWTKNATNQRKTVDNLISNGKAISWSNLLTATGSTGREVILYVEIINSLGSPISGKKRIAVTAKQQSVTEATDEVDVTVIYGDVEKVISDQIAGNECNRLPTNYYKDQPNNPMLMATRTGKDCRIQVVTSIPDAEAANIRVGVRVVDNPSVILGSAASLPAGANTPISFTAVDGKKLYEVVMGYDKNYDSILSNDEVFCIFQKTPKTDPGGGKYTGSDTSFTYLDKILVVTNNDYKIARQDTEDYGDGVVFSNLFPEGAKLLKLFSIGSTSIVGADPAAWGHLVDANIIPSPQGLSHPLGAKWNASNQATTFKISYPPASDLASKVVSSKGFEDLVDRIIKENKPLLVSLATGSLQESAPITFSDDEIAFGDSDEKSDAHLALGKCKSVGSLIVKYRSAPGGNIEIAEINCYGTINDLYDFAFGTKLTVPILGQIDLTKDAARTQAGHSTLTGGSWPNAGRIFFTEVRFGSGWKKWGDTIY